MTGNADKVEAFIELLKPIGIHEMVRTGTVAPDARHGDKDTSSRVMKSRSHS
jgi:acetolactate synthase small subunit